MPQDRLMQQRNNKNTYNYTASFLKNISILNATTNMPKRPQKDFKSFLNKKREQKVKPIKRTAGRLRLRTRTDSK